MVSATKETLLGFVKDVHQLDDESALKKFGEIMKDRYATDGLE